MKYPKLQDAILVGDVEINNGEYYVKIEVLLYALIAVFFTYMWWGSL